MSATNLPPVANHVSGAAVRSRRCTEQSRSFPLNPSYRVDHQTVLVLDVRADPDWATAADHDHYPGRYDLVVALLATRDAQDPTAPTHLFLAQQVMKFTDVQDRSPEDRLSSLMDKGWDHPKLKESQLALIECPPTENKHRIAADKIRSHLSTTATQIFREQLTHELSLMDDAANYRSNLPLILPMHCVDKLSEDNAEDSSSKLPLVTLKESEVKAYKDGTLTLLGNCQDCDLRHPKATVTDSILTFTPNWTLEIDADYVPDLTFNTVSDLTHECDTRKLSALKALQQLYWQACTHGTQVSKRLYEIQKEEVDKKLGESDLFDRSEGKSANSAIVAIVRLQASENITIRSVNFLNEWLESYHSDDKSDDPRAVTDFVQVCGRRH